MTDYFIFTMVLLSTMGAILVFLGGMKFVNMLQERTSMRRVAPLRKNHKSTRRTRRTAEA